jgi:ketose-bisphosphate aldolase
MPLTSLARLTRTALREGYAVAAFNIVDTAMMAGVIDAARQTRSPVIVQVSERTARATGPRVMRAAFEQLVAASGVPAALHLDHCGDAAFVEQCLDSGWESALFDVSHLPYGEALRVTAAMVETARRYDADIEGEFERIGRTGAGSRAPEPYPVAESVRFVRETGVTCFSPAVGTLHGRYVTTPRLDPDRVRAIVRATGVPQVLHGATGLEDGVLRDFVSHGIAKINFSTVLKGAHTEAARAHTLADGAELEPLDLLQDVHSRVAKIASHYLEVLGSHGKAA